MMIRCPYCGQQIDKPAGAVNRARKIGAPIYCGRTCFGRAQRAWKSDEQKKIEKAAYDAGRRERLRDRIKQEKAAYFKRTYDPATAAIKRRERMPRHLEYCRRPEYRKKKAEYDRKLRAAEYGDFAEAYLLLLSTEHEIKQRMTRYEIYQENGTLGKTQRRKRAAARGSVALG